ncbi:S-adenosyl-L-methionine-dependent methyltransferase [Gongronella butleri]|nr:S-adenosyl-L-methionine-dependent methyltransferase [Gongronella butleri]
MTTSDAVAGTKRSADAQDGSAAADVKHVYQVRVDNFPKDDLKNIKNWFKEKGIVQVTKAPKWNYAVCHFDDAKYKNNDLTTKFFAQTEEAFRHRFNKKKKGGNDKPAEEDNRPPAERLAAQVTPLHHLPYEDQLKQKKRALMKPMFELKKKIGQMKDQSERSKGQVDWATSPGMPFGEMEVVASPQIDGYRTKCEFTVGVDPEGVTTVGFQLGMFRHGVTTVLNPRDVKHIPDVAKNIADAMQDYVRASSYPVYEKENKTGVWRTVMTKTQRTGDVLLMIQIQGKDLTEEQLEELKRDMTAYWTSDAMKNERGVPVTTLILQVWDGMSNGITDKGTDFLLHGDGYVYEELLGNRFRLSSSSFFQVNTPACEVLYGKCAEWCNLDKTKRTTLLDLCCGTGTIGITMAKSVDKVIGVDIVPQAIVDARENAERNGVENATYYANKVEDRLDVLTRKQDEELVAVLDPPSCDAKQALPNFISLCRPESNRFSGKPFVPVRVAAVDLFPHTHHCELMIEFKRFVPETVKKDDEKEEAQEQQATETTEKADEAS